ncbi:T9SS type A sorting domain-containing protein [Rufibacter sp. LB8]|uniref:T9SS type A sorting domain-containing protein n=1 Tax=Rufibacter sp. LB8 TaxID=2777781 RepID=UPI00178C2744|nr:T9SS type A sorting domain-containing protein [Rufibacter sp. LB8]
MKRHTTIIALLLLAALEGFGQLTECGFNQVSYNGVSVTTPMGTSISAGTASCELSPGEKTALANMATATYPNAFVIGEATNTYNCHAYAWHMSEGGSTVWIGVANSSAENAYMTDGSYIPWCAETFPSKVSYTADDHSAVSAGQTNILISKWGNGPLMQHHRDDTPYNDGYAYYIKDPKVSGPSELCAPAQYSIPDLPQGLTVTWSATGGISVPANATGGFVTVSKTGNGTAGTLTATITGPCQTLVRTKQVQVGFPSSPGVALSGPASFCGGSQAYSVTNVPYGNTVTWSVSGNLSISGANGGTSVTVTTSGSGPSGTLTANVGGCLVLSKYISPPTPAAPEIYAESEVYAYTYRIYVSAEEMPGATSYNWYWAPGPPDVVMYGNGTKDMRYYTATPGSYYLYVEVPTSCGTAYSNLFAVQVLGDQEWGYSVHPNPSDERLTVQTPAPNEDWVTVEVYNLYGQLKKKVRAKGPAIEVITADLPPDLYVLSINDGRKTVKRRIAVRR